MHHVLATIPDDLFTVGVPLLEKVVRTMAVYLGILVLLRLAGKRDLAQLNNFDLVVLLLLSNVVQNAVIGNDNSLLGGGVGAMTLLAVNAAVVRMAQRSEPVARLLEGEPTVLVRDGQLDEATVRERVCAGPTSRSPSPPGRVSMDDVAEAVLEPGGSIVLRLKPEATPATQADIARLEAKLDQLLAQTG